MKSKPSLKTDIAIFLAVVILGATLMVVGHTEMVESYTTGMTNSILSRQP